LTTLAIQLTAAAMHEMPPLLAGLFVLDMFFTSHYAVGGQHDLAHQIIRFQLSFSFRRLLWQFSQIIHKSINKRVAALIFIMLESSFAAFQTIIINPTFLITKVMMFFR
jgi:hypothetical protein